MLRDMYEEIKAAERGEGSAKDTLKVETTLKAVLEGMKNEEENLREVSAIRIELNKLQQETDKEKGTLRIKIQELEEQLEVFKGC